MLDCDFDGAKLTLFQNGGGYDLEVAGRTYQATLAEPGPDGRVVGVFSMLDAGPVMISVATTEGDTVHPSELTASRMGSAGLAARTTRGTCTEATR